MRPWSPAPVRLPRWPAPAVGAWRPAAFAATPALVASLLFAARLVGLPGLDARGLAIAGLVVIAGCLTTAVLAGGAARSVRTPALATAAALGLVAPALAIHLALARLALRDPAMIVVAPAGASLGLLAGAVVLAAGVALSRRPTLAEAPPALLSVGLPVIWLPLLTHLTGEPVVWGALAFSFALIGAVWCLTALARGWLVVVPAAAAVAASRAAMLALAGPPALSAAGATPLPAAQLALALAGSAAPLAVPAGVAAWRRRRSGSGATGLLGAVTKTRS